MAFNTNLALAAYGHTNNGSNGQHGAGDHHGLGNSGNHNGGAKH